MIRTNCYIITFRSSPAELITERSGRRIFALAKLSFEEAIRRRVLWVFLAFLLDISVLGGSGYANRERAGGFYSGGGTG